MASSQGGTDGRTSTDETVASPSKLPRRFRLLRQPRAVIGVAIIASLTLLAIVVPWLLGRGPNMQTRNALDAASLAHPFGTDELGRDVFTRTLYGVQFDLFLGLVAVPISGLIGTLLGLTGAISARLGSGVQRLLDLIIGFPGMALGVAAAVVVGPSSRAVIITVAIINLPMFGRLARATFLSQSAREYVVAAKLLGVPRRRIMLRHVLPFALDGATAQFAISMAHAIFIEGALSIVGLGIQPPQPSLGSLLKDGFPYIEVNPLYLLAPSLFLACIVLGFTLLADGINEANRT